jgi:hypothetical protein
MRLLVCGGRDFEDREFAFAVLDLFHAQQPVTHIIHGAARGADTLAGEWALSRGIEQTPFPADWSRLRNAAGPIRNAQMLHDGKPDRVFALPGGRGTLKMVGQAKDAGIEVIFASKIER